MGVGLSLMGRYGRRGLVSRPPTPGVWLQRIEQWVRENCGDTLEEVGRVENSNGHPTLCLVLHPAAEAVFVTAAERGVVSVEAKTSTVGPGYHLYVCDLLRRLGQELGIAWEPPDDEAGTGDETGYFHTGDKTAVEREMLTWLQAMARLEDREHGKEPCAWCMPFGHRYSHAGGTVTPLGWRDRAWMQAVAEDPRRGIDFFSWWEEGQNASYHLGRALCQMWRDVRWRRPLLDSETELLAGIAACLERAYRRDASLNYPWLEWHEILAYLEQDSPLAAEVARQAGSEPQRQRIGYRRHEVIVDLASPWSIRIPGSFAETWEGDTWSAWDPPRTVWFTSYTFNDESRPTPSAAEALRLPGTLEGDPLEFRRGSLLGQAVLKRTEEDGQEYWLLSARSAVPGALALCTVCFDDLADRQWAIDTWHSLSHASSQ
jgi:hypothetical protein